MSLTSLRAEQVVDFSTQEKVNGVGTLVQQVWFLPEVVLSEIANVPPMPVHFLPEIEFKVQEVPWQLVQVESWAEVERTIDKRTKERTPKKRKARFIFMI